MKKILLSTCLLLTTLGMAQNLTSHANVQDNTLTVKELSSCEKTDLDKAQKAFDDAQDELKRVETSISNNYRKSCEYTEVHGKYIFIWNSYVSCFTFYTNNAITVNNH